MIRLLFCCHGNICRSPMAEFLMKDMVRIRQMESEFMIASAATSAEELGNPVHRGTKKKLAEHGIRTDGKYAVQLRPSDYDNYDYIIAMEQRNIRNILAIVGEDKAHKISRLLDFTARPGDIADPWYTGNFDATFDDITAGLEALLISLSDTYQR